MPTASRNQLLRLLGLIFVLLLAACDYCCAQTDVGPLASEDAQALKEARERARQQRMKDVAPELNIPGGISRRGELVPVEIKAVPMPLMRQPGAPVMLGFRTPGKKRLSLSLSRSRETIQLRIAIRTSNLLQDPADPIVERLHRLANEQAEDYIGSLEASEVLDSQMKEKLLLAAECDASRAARAIRGFLQENGEIFEEDIRQIRNAMGAVNELNDIVMDHLSGTSNLFNKVLDSILSGDDKHRIAESYLNWFVSPQGIRYKITDPAVKQSLLSELFQHMDRSSISLGRRRYCIEVVGAVPPERLIEILGPGMAALESAIRFHSTTSGR